MLLVLDELKQALLDDSRRADLSARRIRADPHKLPAGLEQRKTLSVVHWPKSLGGQSMLPFDLRLQLNISCCNGQSAITLREQPH